MYTLAFCLVHPELTPLNINAPLIWCPYIKFWLSAGALPSTSGSRPACLPTWEGLIFWKFWVGGPKYQPLPGGWAGRPGPNFNPPPYKKYWKLSGPFAPPLWDYNLAQNKKNCAWAPRHLAHCRVDLPLKRRLLSAPRTTLCLAWKTLWSIKVFILVSGVVFYGSMHFTAH